MPRQSSTLGDVLALLFAPLVWLLRPWIGRKRPPPNMVRAFYKTAAWKRLRYAHLTKSPACLACGRSAKDGARMNVDHIKPLHRHWHLRLAAFSGFFLTDYLLLQINAGAAEPLYVTLYRLVLNVDGLQLWQ